MARIGLLAVVLMLAGAAQDATSTGLARIYREYQELRSARDVTRLVLLDQQLRSLVPKFGEEGRPPLSATYWVASYRDLGVAHGMFDRDHLTYSGKLLAEAHALNPRSPLRSHTLYSTIFSPEGEASNNLPSRDRAEDYVREFPTGPFIVEALLTLAHFYDDLFKVIKLEETGGRIGYKYDCFVPYLTSQPLPDQRRAAQEAGMRAYERLVVLRPGQPTFKEELSALRNGTTRSWHSCAD